MKNFALLFLLLAFAFVSQAQTIKQPTSAKKAPSVTLSADDEIRFKISNDIAINLIGEKFNLVTNNFDTNLKTTLKEDMIRGAWYQFKSWRGDFVQIESITPGVEQGLKTMNVVCRFDNAYGIIVSVFKDKQVTGLWLR